MCLIMRGEGLIILLLKCTVNIDGGKKRFFFIFGFFLGGGADNMIYNNIFFFYRRGLVELFKETGKNPVQETADQDV